MVNQERIERARISLQGLSVGDAFGDRFFLRFEDCDRIVAALTLPGPPFDFTDDTMQRLADIRCMPDAPWPYTDDTEMAMSIVAVLAQRDEIDEDLLALSFGQHFNLARKYGAAMTDLLPAYAKGAAWRIEAPKLFHGQGSCGNGSAMRVAPVGAYFADDLEATVANARRSSMVTHTHSEGIAGAIAVAIAAAQAWRTRGALPEPAKFIESVLPYVPASDVRHGLETAAALEEDAPADVAADILGNGDEITAQDTVPFCIWCAAQFMDSYEEALWQTVSALGDRDTTCAIVGGIVACYTGVEGIPATWRAAREPLADWSQV